MAGNYRVTGQRPSSRVTPTSQIEKTIEVSFTTVPGGYAGTVEIPQNQYSAAAVDALIKPLATEMETVGNMGQG